MFELGRFLREQEIERALRGSGRKRIRVTRAAVGGRAGRELFAISRREQIRAPFEDERKLAAIAGVRAGPGDGFPAPRLVMRDGIIQREFEPALRRIGHGLDARFEVDPALGLAFALALKAVKALRSQRLCGRRRLLRAKGAGERGEESRGDREIAAGANEIILSYCCATRMPARVSETYVLRTYPFRESDLIVSFFTRDQGKLRGVARRARKPKSSFGSGLERLSLVNLSYGQKETRELVNLNSCELVQSQFDLLSNFEVGVALDYVAEVSDHMLPPHEPNERFFRLLGAVLTHMHEGANGAAWAAITYFSVWATKLSGFLPDLATHPERTLSAGSRELAAAMLRRHVAELPAMAWTKDTALDLRRFLIRQMEEHVERRFHTPPLLEGL